MKIISGNISSIKLTFIIC